MTPIEKYGAIQALISTVDRHLKDKPGSGIEACTIGQKVIFVTILHPVSPVVQRRIIYEVTIDDQ
ncbi:MAG: hypothetical protein M0Q91_05450 [Methanoregula sp.]|jgi:hypothetical protein|nr:hypothetical protein [Methanoregula sp.]